MKKTIRKCKISARSSAGRKKKQLITKESDPKRNCTNNMKDLKLNLVRNVNDGKTVCSMKILELRQCLSLRMIVSRRRSRLFKLEPLQRFKMSKRHARTNLQMLKDAIIMS